MGCVNSVRVMDNDAAVSQGDVKPYPSRAPPFTEYLWRPQKHTAGRKARFVQDGGP